MSLLVTYFYQYVSHHMAENCLLGDCVPFIQLALIRPFGLVQRFFGPTDLNVHNGMWYNYTAICADVSTLSNALVLYTATSLFHS